MSHVRSEFNFKELFEKLEEIESTGISGISMSPVLNSRHSEIIRQINLLIPKILDYENFIDSIPQGKTIDELMAMDDERKAGYLNESIRQYIALSDMGSNLDALITRHRHINNQKDSYNRAWLIKAMKGKNEKIQKISRSIKKYVSETKPSIAWLREYFYENGPTGGHLTTTSLFTFIQSLHYQYSELLLAYINAAPKDMVTSIQEKLIKTSKKSFELNDMLIQLSPRTLSPTELLNITACDDRHILLTKKIFDRYKDEGLDFDILNAITPNSLKSFDYMISQGYDKTEDTDVCVSRICQLPSTPGMIDKRKHTLMTFMQKGRKLSCPSVVSMFCISNDAPELFDYLLSIRAFGDLNKNTSRLIDIVSDIMKFDKFDYFKYLEKYYIIHADSLKNFKNKIDSYPTLRVAYSNESYDWLTETIRQINADDYTIK